MKVSAFALLVLFLSGCANGPCMHMRQQQLADRAGSGATATPAVTETPIGSGAAKPLTDSGVSVFVSKPDGSLQCGARGVSAEEMEKQLKGIKVISRDKRSDGKMHIQVCGSPTGQLNIYEIPESSLKDAEARGFTKQ